MHHAARLASTDAKMKKFSIYRWNPDVPGDKPRMQEYNVNMNEYVTLVFHLMKSPTLLLPQVRPYGA